MDNFATESSSALVTPLAGQSAAGSKRDRRTLTKIDRRLPFGKRVSELTAAFAQALGGGDLSPLRKLAVDKAAQLTAIAEKARGDFMRDAIGNLDDIVRAERKADQAVRALNINEAKPRGPSLLAQLAAGAR